MMRTPKKTGKTLEELGLEDGGPEAVEEAPMQGASYRTQSTRRGHDIFVNEPTPGLEMVPVSIPLPAPTGALAALLARLGKPLQGLQPETMADVESRDLVEEPSELERQLRASLELKGIPMGCVECQGLGKPGLRGCSLCYRQRVQDSTIISPEESLQKQFNLPPLRPPVVEVFEDEEEEQPERDISGDAAFPSGTFSHISGQAGTGKTYLLRNRPHSEELVATTGIAAINLGGATINSLLGYFDLLSLKDGYVAGTVQARLRGLYDQGCRRVNLDEVSMLGGDALDVLVDIFDDLNEQLQQKGRAPMGLTLCGDFAQLPPVKAPFAFEAKNWDRFERSRLVLTEIRRQSDRAFVEALQAVRAGEANRALEFFAGRFVGALDSKFKGSTIKSKNDEVDRYNGLMLRELSGESLVVENMKAGVQRGEWKNIPLELEVKKGALVMVLANRRTEEMPPGCYDYVNGDLALFLEIVPGPARPGGGPSDRAKVKLLRDESTVVVDRARRVLTEGAGKDAKEIGSVDYLPLRLAWATTCHKCVRADTLVRTQRGLVPILEVEPGVDYVNGLKVLARAPSKKFPWRITTARGYTVVASGEHRWKTEEGWKETRQLEIEDRIRLSLGVPDSRENSLAWWLGATVGNGTYADRTGGQIHFSTLDPVLGDMWRSVALDRGAPHVAWRADRRGLHMTSKPFREQLARSGLDYLKGGHKRTPKVVLEGGPAWWRSFLQGLFDCDGHVGKSYVVLTTASERLGQEVQQMLLALGVVSRRSKYRGVKDPYWQVSISGDGLAAFRQIGFKVAKAKQQKLEGLTPNRVIQPFDGADRVVTVEELPGLAEEMWDLEVAAPHEVSFGGLLGHNSQGLSLDQVQVDIRGHFFTSPGMLYVALSRARTAEGLRLVGNESLFKARCTVNRKVKPWL